MSATDDIRPRTINRMTRDVWPGFALLAGVQLDVFTTLSSGPTGAEEIARRLDVDPERLRPVLYALAEFGLLIEADGRFENTPEAAAYLDRASPRHMRMLASFTPRIWGAALSTAESVRTGEPRARLDFATAPRSDAELFLRSRHPGALTVGRELARRYDLTGRRSLLDVGGGTGGVALALAEALPDLHATVLELPSVAPIARAAIREHGPQDRVRVVTGDVTREPVEGDYDLVVMKALLQILSRDDARATLLNVAPAVVPGGEIHIVGDILDDSRRSPRDAVSFNLVLLSLYPHGQAYTEGEYRAWLAEAGFTDVTRVQEHRFTSMRAVKSG